MVVPVARVGGLAVRLCSPRRRAFSQQQQQQQQQSPRPMSPHIGFYRSFGRPMAKTILGAIFVYQVTYWAWSKLETDEIRRLKEGEIRQLEARVRDAL